MASTHPITDALALLATQQERAAHKAGAVRTFTAWAGRSWTRTVNGHVYVLTILTAPTVSGGALTLDLGLTRDGLAVPLDGPFVFVNPPVLVDDPAGDIVRSMTDPRTGQTTTRVLREDVLAAVRAMVLDAVRDKLR